MATGDKPTPRACRALLAGHVPNPGKTQARETRGATTESEMPSRGMSKPLNVSDGLVNCQGHR